MSEAHESQDFARTHRATEAVVWLIVLYPIAGLAVRGGLDALFAVIAALSLYHIGRQRVSGARDAPLPAGSALYQLAMAGFFLAIAASEIVHRDFRPQPFDGALRFVLAIPIYRWARTQDLRSLRVLALAFIVAALSTPLFLMINVGHWAGQGRARSYFLDPIHYGDLALLLGALAVLSLGWAGTDPKSRRVMATIAGAAGLGASLATGSRGGWVALPVFVGLWLYRDRDRHTVTRRLLVITAGILAAGALYLWVPEVHERLNAVPTDLLDYDRGYLNTSVGIRFQIWRAAVILFLKHPLFGVGPGRFGPLLAGLADHHVISTVAATFGKAEVHNEILAYAVKLGVPGLVAVTLVYLAPGILFWRASRDTEPLRRGAGVLGLAVVLGFLVFGLTVEIFDLKVMSAFYSLTVALLLAIATHPSLENNRL